MNVVELPNGDTIEFPDSVGPEEMSAAINQQMSPAGTLERPASLVPGHGGEITPEIEETVAPHQMPYPQQTFDRETAKEYLPLAGGIAGTATGGTSLIPSAIGAAVGASAGEATKQKLQGKTPDLWDVVNEGALAGGGTLAGGLIFKGLAEAAKMIFRPKPLPPGSQKAAEFAQKEGVPLPLSGADPTSRGAMMESMSSLALPGRLRNIKDARAVNTFINTTTQKMTSKAKAIDEVAVKGQGFFKSIYGRAKEAGEEGFQKFVGQVGQDTPIPLRNFTDEAAGAVQTMKEAGISGALMTKLRTIQKAGTTQLPLEFVEGIRKDIGKIARRTNNVKVIGDKLKEAIMKDYDEVGAQLGISAREMSEEAIAKYAQFAKLTKEFPQLGRFGKEFGERGGTMGSRQWFGELFTEGNAKALNEIRKESPALYRELSDTWLAQLLERNSTASTGMFGKVLDGERFRKYFKANENTFKKILGKEKTEVLNNFSRYTEKVGELLKTKPIEGQEAAMRLGEIAGTVKFPAIFIPNEAASYMLAKGLSDPKSQLYKLFTTGPSLSFKKGAKLSLEALGQSAAGGIFPGP